MRVLLIGATGTIGSAVATALSHQHEVLEASRHAPYVVDISDPESIKALYGRIGDVDAVISAAGDTRRKPLAQLSDDDFAFCLINKLMGQVNLVRYGLGNVRRNGSFVLTSGILGRQPMVGSEAISLVNLGVEGFVRAAALEMPRGVRINVVSPPWVTETLELLKMSNVPGLPASAVAQAYVEAIHGDRNGDVIEPRA